MEKGRCNSISIQQHFGKIRHELLKTSQLFMIQLQLLKVFRTKDEIMRQQLTNHGWIRMLRQRLEIHRSQRTGSENDPPPFSTARPQIVQLQVSFCKVISALVAEFTKLLAYILVSGCFRDALQNQHRNPQVECNTESGNQSFRSCVVKTLLTSSTTVRLT